MQREARNTRDPSQQPPSRQGGSYKPKAKSSAAERGSEGTVVVAMVATNNATGAKGPCGGRVDGAGKREGMAAKSGPNDPGGPRPREKVRQLQRRLCAAAKRQPGRRFHALYGHISRSDVLLEAWRRVRSNKGAAGVDRQTLVEVEQQGVERFLPIERQFLSLPFSHSETVADQDFAVAFTANEAVIADDADKERARVILDFASKHRDVVRKFGRFPHRNVMLSRESTAEETEFLKGGRGY